MTPDGHALRSLVGLHLSAIDSTGAPNFWRLEFGQGASLAIETLWRVLAEGRVTITSEDHRQQFGLPAPVDVGSRLFESLGGQVLSAASYDDTTGDLTLNFASGARFEVITTSAGYENWNISLPDGTQLIALGGGEVVVSSSGAAG